LSIALPLSWKVVRRPQIPKILLPPIAMTAGAVKARTSANRLIDDSGDILTLAVRVVKGKAHRRQ